MRSLEAIKRANKNWVMRNPDKVKLYQKRYRSTEEYKRKRREKRRNAPRDNRLRDKQTMREHRLSNRDAVIAHYGGKCFCCGEANKGFLTVDHIDGQAPEIAVVGKKLGHSALYKYLVKNNFPEGYRLACANCNLGIGWWGVCPHKKEPY